MDYKVVIFGVKDTTGGDSVFCSGEYMCCGFGGDDSSGCSFGE